MQVVTLHSPCLSKPSHNLSYFINVLDLASTSHTASPSRTDLPICFINPRVCPQPSVMDQLQIAASSPLLLLPPASPVCAWDTSTQRQRRLMAADSLRSGTSLSRTPNCLPHFSFIAKHSGRAPQTRSPIILMFWQFEGAVEAAGTESQVGVVLTQTLLVHIVRYGC